jgi:hypothetical protein
MNARTFAIVFAALIGVPLLCAALICLCPSTTVAVVVCLVLAAVGAIGAGYAVHLILPQSHQPTDCTQNHRSGLVPAGAISQPRTQPRTNWNAASEAPAEPLPQSATANPTHP